MGRSYAGILGPLAFLTEIIRGVSQAGGVNSTVSSAVAALFLFAAIGFVLGELAAWVIDESVRSRLVAEIAAAKPNGELAKPAVATQMPATAAVAAAKPNVAAASTKSIPQPAKPTAQKTATATANGAAAAKPNKPAIAGATK